MCVRRMSLRSPPCTYVVASGTTCGTGINIHVAGEPVPPQDTGSVQAQDPNALTPSLLTLITQTALTKHQALASM